MLAINTKMNFDLQLCVIIILVGTLKDKFLCSCSIMCMFSLPNVALQIVLIMQAMKESCFFQFFSNIEGKRRTTVPTNVSGTVANLD